MWINKRYILDDNYDIYYIYFICSRTNHPLNIITCHFYNQDLNNFLYSSKKEDKLLNIKKDNFPVYTYIYFICG